MNEHDLKLIRDYLDDRISPEGLKQLNRLLESDADARAEFRAMATLEEGLRDLSVTTEGPFPVQDSIALEREPKRRAGRWYRVEHIGIAALFVACVALAVLLMRRDDRKQDKWGDAIARIEFLSHDAAFAPDHKLPNTEGSLLRKGWVQLDRGRATILFRSGVTVEAEGRVTLGLDTPMRAYLDFGKVKVHAPESGRDFIVATESMEVVDLGTRFEVTVDPQSRESNVTVVEGLVDLQLGSRGAEREIRPLEAGFAARVDASGKIVEITKESGIRPKSETHDVRILAHWAFDEIGTTGKVEDSSGSRLDGVLRTGKPAVVSAGVSGQSLSFEDRDTYVDLNEHISTLTQHDAFTFAAWTRDPDHRLAMLFSVSGDSEQHRVQVYVASRFVRLGWQDGLHFDSISGRVDGWDSGQWYHVAVTTEEGVARLYRDGELLASGCMGSKIGTSISSPSMVKDASHAYLGRLEDGRQGVQSSHQWFTGQMDDVQLYSGALSQEAIQFLYEHPGQSWKTHEHHQ